MVMGIPGGGMWEFKDREEYIRTRVLRDWLKD